MGRLVERVLFEGLRAAFCGLSGAVIIIAIASVGALGGCNQTSSVKPKKAAVERSQDAGAPSVIRADAQARYGIAGNVEGIVGSVTVELNGEEQLTLSKNGPFSFRRGVDDGKHYLVEVVEQPEDEYCVVERGDGVIDGEPITDVLVYCEPGNPGIADVVFSAGSLQPAFSAEVSRYRVDVPLWASRVEVEPMLADNDAKVTVDGEEYRGRALPVDLTLGQNTVQVKSTVENGEVREYTVDIYRATQVVETAYGKANVPVAGSQFGFAVAVEGDLLAVGSPSNNSASQGVGGDEDNQDAPNSGAVYLFRKTDSSWKQEAFIKAHNAGEGDLFGYSVALSQGRLLVGAASEAGSQSGVDSSDDDRAPGAGAAYTYVLKDGEWVQEAYLKADTPNISAGFGQSVAVEADRIAIGAYHEPSSAVGVDSSVRDEAAPDSGAVYVFELQDGGWTQTAYLKASNTDAGDSFGESVALEDSTIVVGAPGERGIVAGVDGDQSSNESLFVGAAYVFSLDDENQSWFQDAYLKASNASERQWFGKSVSVSGNTVVVGAYAENSSNGGVSQDAVDADASNQDAMESGAAYVFVRGEAGEWHQQAYLKASNPDERDHFGQHVELISDSLVISAGLEASAGGTASSAELDLASDNSAPAAGAVYVFFRKDEQWTQEAYIKASNAESGDNFGLGLAFDGAQIVVGAPFEDSATSGVHPNGGPNNASASSGAFYVY